MKHALLSTLVACQLLAADDAPQQVQIEAEFIEVSEAAVTGALHGPNPPRSGLEWRALTDRLLQEQQATVITSLAVVTKSGNRATADAAKELIYATEFDPAKGREAGSPDVPKDVSGVDVPTPTAFEMRPVGSKLEVDPVIGADGKTVDVAVSFEHIYHTGDTVHQEIASGAGRIATMKQPSFYSMKVATSVTIANESTVLTGILVPRDKKGEADPTRRVLCLVRATIVGG